MTTNLAGGRHCGFTTEGGHNLLAPAVVGGKQGATLRDAL